MVVLDISSLVLPSCELVRAWLKHPTRTGVEHEMIRLAYEGLGEELFDYLGYERVEYEISYLCTLLKENVSGGSRCWRMSQVFLWRRGILCILSPGEVLGELPDLN